MAKKKHEDATTAKQAGRVERVTGPEVPYYYANATGVETSIWDVRLRFGQAVEVDHETKVTKVREVAVVSLSPQHAKVVVGILLQHLEKYERDFGKIPSRPDSPPEVVSRPS